MIEERINILKREIIEYSSLVEKMIFKSIDSLFRRNIETLKNILDVDENIANEKEIEIEELCIETIAQFEPRAKDLRTIIMIMKMNNDFERIGDHAVNIAQSSIFLINNLDILMKEELNEMFDETLSMFKDSIRSFTDNDVKLAKDVCVRDDKVDNLRNRIFRNLISLIKKSPEKSESLLRILNISSNLERIADLATNICEDVIFIAEGRIIKHHKDER